MVNWKVMTSNMREWQLGGKAPSLAPKYRPWGGDFIIRALKNGPGFSYFSCVSHSLSPDASVLF